MFFCLLKEEIRNNNNNNSLISIVKTSTNSSKDKSATDNDNDDDENTEENKWGSILVTKSDVINNFYPKLEENVDLNSFSSQSKFGTLLKKWGWKGEGHGIGKLDDGISEPISLQVYSNRQGLGSKEMVPFSYVDDFESPAIMQDVSIINLKDKAKIMRNLKTFLNDYLHSKCLSEIEFEAKFSNEERRLIHQEAHRIGLKTRSLGVGENRYLTIGKKRSPVDILENIVANSGQFGKYKLLNN